MNSPGTHGAPTSSTVTVERRPADCGVPPVGLEPQQCAESPSSSDCAAAELRRFRPPDTSTPGISDEIPGVDDLLLGPQSVLDEVRQNLRENTDEDRFRATHVYSFTLFAL